MRSWTCAGRSARPPTPTWTRRASTSGSGTPGPTRAAAAALAAEGRTAEALALWRGELLEGLEAGDWLDGRRDERRARPAARCWGRWPDGPPPRAITRARSSRARERVALEPLSEEAHRDLIARLAAAGDRAAARDRLRPPVRPPADRAGDRAVAGHPRAGRARAGGRCRRPRGPRRDGRPRGRGTRAARAAPARRSRPSSPHAASAPRSSAATPQRDRLLAALDGVRGGERRLVLVAGEPGIGKTRLVAEAARRAHAAGATVLAGRCHEEPLGPFAPFVEALRPLGTLRRSSRRRRRAPRACGSSTRRPSCSPARRRRVVLVLDDLHWADRPRCGCSSPRHRAGARRAAAASAPTATPSSAAAIRSPPCSRTCAASRGPSASPLGGLDAEATTRLIGGWVGPEAGPELAARSARRRRATRSSSRRCCATSSRAARSCARTAAGAPTAR